MVRSLLEPLRPGFRFARAVGSVACVSTAVAVNLVIRRAGDVQAVCRFMKVAWYQSDPNQSGLPEYLRYQRGEYLLPPDPGRQFAEPTVADLQSPVTVNDIADLSDETAPAMSSSRQGPPPPSV